MPATTMLLTLFLVGVSGASPHGESGLPAQGQSPDLSARAPEATETTGQEEGGNFSAANRDSTSVPPRRTTLGGFTQQPIVRGALIGAILGAVIGLLGGAVVGVIMGGVVRALP